MIRIFLLFLLLFPAPFAWAQTHYITDIVKITLRTGPGVDHRVMAMVRSGQPVEVLKPEDEWTLIRLPDGKEGWVLSRLLSTEKPVVVLYDELKENYDALEKKMKAPMEIIEELKAENRDLKTKLDREKEEYEKLKAARPEPSDKEAAKALQRMKHDYDQLSERYAQMAKRAAKAEKKGLFGFLDERMIWFLIGGGVLLVGFLVGFIAKRGRRRSTIY